MTNGSCVRKLERDADAKGVTQRAISQRKLAVDERVEDGDCVAMANDSTRSSAMSDVFIVLFTFLAQF